MSTARPGVQKLSADELRSDLDTALARVSRNESAMIVEQDGKPLATIVQADELERLRRLEAEWERPFAVIERMRAAFTDLSEDEIERDVADAVTRTRAAVRQSTGAREPA